MQERSGWTILVALLAAIAVAAGLGWFLVGATGLAIACVGGTLAVAGLAAWFNLAANRQMNLLWKFVQGYSNGNKPDISPESLPGPARRVAWDLAEQFDRNKKQIDSSIIEKREGLNLHMAQAARERAESIINHMSDAVFVTNEFGELVFANREAARLLRIEVNKLIGNTLRSVLGDCNLTEITERAIQTSAQRQTSEISFTPNGRPHWYKLHIVGIKQKGEETQGLLIVLHDVTKEKAAQSRAAEFVSAVSHEIKTPLASVKAYAEMLADGDADDDPETQAKFLGIIQAQTDRMNRLLEGMLDIARIESGVVRIEKKIVSLNELVENNAKLMQPAACNKNISLESRLSPLFVGVSADQDMMSRVAMNLISNAIKYTDPGGRVELRTQMLQDEAVFEVQDTGRGIPADSMEKLFTKFYRVKENNDAAPGTGLGLSLVKHITEEVHGGRVEVESQVGQGSTFRVRLPLQAVH